MRVPAIKGPIKDFLGKAYRAVASSSQRSLAFQTERVARRGSGETPGL